MYKSSLIFPTSTWNRSSIHILTIPIFLNVMLSFKGSLAFSLVSPVPMYSCHIQNHSSKGKDKSLFVYIYFPAVMAKYSAEIRWFHNRERVLLSFTVQGYSTSWTYVQAAEWWSSGNTIYSIRKKRDKRAQCSALSPYISFILQGMGWPELRNVFPHQVILDSVKLTSWW